MATPIPKNAAPFTSYWIAAATGGDVSRGEGTSGRGITTDSREVVEGGAFVAIRGENSDGHDHVQSAIDRGARLLVVGRGRAPTLTVTGAGAVDVIEVDDTLRAWGDIARAHLREWRIRRGPGNATVVAITGSAGKTTTKELCAALLRERGVCFATPGNLNNRLGLPAAALAVTDDVRYAVLEAGMSVRGEIAELARIAAPNVAVITNVGVAHAEGVGGRRSDVAREKGALFEGLHTASRAIANADDDAACAQLVRTNAARYTFGRAASADYRLVDRASLGVSGSKLTILRRRHGDEARSVEVTLPLVGEAAAVDFVAALAAAECVAHDYLPDDVIARAVAKLRPFGGRGEAIRLATGAMVIDDSYNANPASMRAALESASEIARAESRRLLVVLGEMRELGVEAEREHAALAESIEAAGARVAVGCGGLIDRALDRLEARAAKDIEIVRAKDADAAGGEVVSRVKPGDLILVKGSRGVATERVVRALVAAYGHHEVAPGPR